MKAWQLKVFTAVAVGVPALFIRFSGAEAAPLASLVIFGIAIVGAASLLAWAAEAAQVDISAGLAVAILALIAVLPEYAVDLYFAYVSGSDPQFGHYAAANMTGSNRLLLGLGWPAVAFVFILGARKAGHQTKELVLDDRRRTELTFLVVASVYAFIIPAMRQITLVDTVVLLALFAAYLKVVASEEQSDPELVGVAADIGSLPRAKRRSAVGALFAVAAVIVLASAEPFAHALVESGTELGIDEFLLVQWLAPLASESPEFIVAAILAFRGNGDAGLGTLLSSKVNQWTLLVGSIPLAHFIGGGGFDLGLDMRQTEEFLLTTAQTVLGIAMLINLRFSLKESAALFGLFAVQFVFPGVTARLLFSAVYLLVAAVLLLRRPESVAQVWRTFISLIATQGKSAERYARKT
ncbi:MAG: sodium/hydrogen exchanger [Thermoleophilia bacterium]